MARRDTLRVLINITMIYTQKIKDAIKFAIKTHEVYQKQKRKGKDIPYITHPLTVGLILARAGASEDVIVAGILHDTMEDSIAENKVTREMLAECFGEEVASLVESVTEMRKYLPWDERKREALEHIETFTNESLLLKSADIISNLSELLDDQRKDGEGVWERFNAPKEKILRHANGVISAIRKRWPENPLTIDLDVLAEGLATLALTRAGQSEQHNPSTKIERERQFHVRNFSEDIIPSDAISADIVQDYLVSTERGVRRIRKITVGETQSYFFTEKVATGEPGVNIEHEREISADEYERYYKERDLDLNTIVKTRYSFPYADKTYELDVFASPKPTSFPDVVLEIEHQDKGEALEVPRGWDVVDVTGQYSNYARASRMIG